jgi:hypothetical protein
MTACSHSRSHFSWIVKDRGGVWPCPTPKHGPTHTRTTAWLDSLLSTLRWVAAVALTRHLALAVGSSGGLAVVAFASVTPAVVLTAA